MMSRFPMAEAAPGTGPDMSANFASGNRMPIGVGSTVDGKLANDGPMMPAINGQVTKSITCCQCQQTFGDQGSLQRHAARAHRSTGIKGPVVCEQCNAELKNEQNLKRHIAVCHTGQQEHQCHLCNASFSSRGSLRIHQQQVHNIPTKPNKKAIVPAVAADAEAGAAGSSRAKSRPPKAAKTADKSWACDMCSDTFKWKGNLKRHRELRHLHLRPFTCTVCRASFGTKSNMRVHAITHDSPQIPDS
jgi:KRAB domain-containing zinc finger protein